MKSRPSVPEPARRRPVWVALAALYLDTELQEDELQRIATVLAASAFAWDEARQINYDEVAPALWPNLLSVAGEWAGWDEEWLVARLTAHYTGTRHRLLGSERLWQRQVDFYTADYLARIAAFLP